MYLDWNDNSQIFDYDVSYTTDPAAITSPESANWTNLPNATGLQITRYWHTGLSVGTNYHYKLQAYDYFGNSITPCYTNATVVSATPPATTNFNAFASAYDGMVLVEWMARYNNNSGLVTSVNQTNWQFYVERKPAGTGDTNYLVISDIGFGLAYLDSAVVDGQAYTYRGRL